MTRYDAIPGHPLAGVPAEVLETATEALGAWPETDAWHDDLVAEVADALVANLRSRGYLTWPTRLPDRDALVLAVSMRIGWWRQGVDDNAPLADFLVDEVVLPLLRSLNGGDDGDGSTDPDDEGGGVRRADAGA